MRSFLQFIFDLLYHPFSWSYDLVAGIISLGRWNEWVKSVIPLIQGRTILETGFGPGHLQKELNLRGYQVHGIDESRQMVRQASHRLYKDHIQGNLVRGLSQHLPYRQAFDTVIATFPSEYIFDPNTIKEIHRVLIPGGRVIILFSVVIGYPRPPEFGSSTSSKISGQRRIIHHQNRINQYLQLFVSDGFNMETRYISFRPFTLLVFYGKKPEEQIA
jgi:ubiquinone/menaquinone biosynthesis C-methylase UbiE